MNEHEDTKTRPASGNDQLAAGDVFADKYEIVSYISSGGMGTVYKVKHLLLKSELALKILRSTEKNAGNLARRFQLEANTGFSLNHANLVKVFDMGVTPDSVPYFTMELVDGITLSEYLKTNRAPRPWAECEIFMKQTCAALDHAHERGVIHRDIKPANIMLVGGDIKQIKILDFGIAKLYALNPEDQEQITATGDIFGSPLYMSPEQCSGDQIDQRTDIYSLGCVFFEMLTGTPPHVGTNALRTMMLHQSADAPSLKEASLGVNFNTRLEEIQSKMLARNPNMRYSSLAEVAHDLKQLNQATPQRNGGVNVNDTNRKSFVAAAAGAVVLAVAASVTLLSNHNTGAFFAGDHTVREESKLNSSVASPLQVNKTPSANANPEVSTDSARADDAALLAVLKQPSVATSGAQHLQLDDKTFAKLHPEAQAVYKRGNEFAQKKDYFSAHPHYSKCLTLILQDLTEHGRSPSDMIWLSRCYGLITTCKHL